MKKTLVITEVGFDLDEDEKDDMQFVPLARTVTRFGRLAGLWFNLNNWCRWFDKDINFVG